MFARFFSAPVYENGAWSTFQDGHLLDTDRIVSYEYTKRWCRPGTFSLSLPYDREIISLIGINGTVWLDGDWLLIQDISYEPGKLLTITGKDCKGLLDLRLTTYGSATVAGAEGYDVIAGTTAVCIKHYLDSNAISPTTAARMLPLIWDSTSVSGLTSDSYMARLEVLSEVIAKLCDGADIGYDVKGDLVGDRCFAFRILQGVDRSFEQSANPRIIFSESWGNVRRLGFEHGVSDLYNVIFAEDSNEKVKVVNRGSGAPSGVSRRECTVSVGVSSTDTDTRDYFDKYVLEQVTDNVETHSYEVEPAASSGYGVDYSLGDIVTVRDSGTGNLHDAKITEVTKSYSQGRRDIRLVFGRQKQKPLQKIVNDLISGTARRR